MYKIETHLHTTYISKCGWLGAEGIVRMYRACGYDAICVTDHYNRTCFDYAEIDLAGEGSRTEAFLLGYRRVRDEAERYGIRVYEGAEVRFDGSENDYLVFGFHHDLLAEPDRIMREGLKVFSDKCRQDGALLIQAHPYRSGTHCTPAPAAYLDGVEIFNGNARQDNRNDLALAYAKEHGLLMLSGSDFHRPGDQGQAGILTDTLPEDGFQLADLIRSGQYKLITPEEELHEIM